MSVISMKQLLEAGVHFGHQTRRWNPKMAPYIYTERNGIYIIDLQQSVGMVDDAYNAIADIVANGGNILFVGTKKQAQDAIKTEAERCGQFYVNERWLGGMLTNFKTIQSRIAKLKEMVKDIPRIEVAELMTKYPQGGERFLIKAVTDREINSAMLPADAGCVVDNVDTVIAVYEAVILGKPVMDRIVTVTGQGIKNPQNFDVLSGTVMAELIEAAGGLTDNVSKVISGGPMMGFAMYDTHVPCIKTSSACLCLEKDDVADAEQTACINCGRCVGVCPGHVIPARLATFAEHGGMESFQKFDGMEC